MFLHKLSFCLTEVDFNIIMNTCVDLCVGLKINLCSHRQEEKKDPEQPYSSSQGSATSFSEMFTTDGYLLHREVCCRETAEVRDPPDLQEASFSLHTAR